jgi:Flp pilus assembly protein protease CpaA
MSTGVGVYLVSFLLLATVYDLWTRTIPNWVTLLGLGVGIVGGLLGWWTWEWVWMLVGPLPLWIADVGRGDVKAASVLGGLCGWWIGPIILLAFGLLIPFWLVYHLGYSRHYPGTWPFFPLLSGSTCVMLAAGWL